MHTLGQCANGSMAFAERSRNLSAMVGTGNVEWTRGSISVRFRDRPNFFNGVVFGSSPNSGEVKATRCNGTYNINESISSCTFT